MVIEENKISGKMVILEESIVVQVEGQAYYTRTLAFIVGETDMIIVSSGLTVESVVHGG
jgi:hypothetical protein